MNLRDHLRKEALCSQSKAKKYTNKSTYSRPISAYEHLLGISMNNVLWRLKKKQNHPLIVLDVMCGGGSAVRELNHNYNVDAFSIDTLFYPEHRSSEYKDRFIITPAENLEMIADESIDLILNVIGYTEFSSSLYSAMREALRVLCRGGELYSVPFISRAEVIDAYCREGYIAMDDYERKTGQKLRYQVTRKALPWRKLIQSFIASVQFQNKVTLSL